MGVGLWYYVAILGLLAVGRSKTLPSNVASGATL